MNMPAGFAATFDARLVAFLDEIDRECGLRQTAPELHAALLDYLKRSGKRLRPWLMLLAYEGYSPRREPAVWNAALALELFHAFALVHDDIVDRSPVRRGGPAMHVLLEGPRGGGRELAMLAGDVVYAMAVRKFLSCTDDPRKKLSALDELTRTAVRTGAGAFAELRARERPLGSLSGEEIVAIYDLKTSLYTFACPLRVGAILGGAPEPELERLLGYGLLLGRAFQLRDDLEDLATLLDAPPGADAASLAEIKTTLPLWFAWRAAGEPDRQGLAQICESRSADRKLLGDLRAILERTGALNMARRELDFMVASAIRAGEPLTMGGQSRQALQECVEEALQPALQEMSA
jgi:geranylgeranyl diphosphate synthase type I